MRKKYMKIDNQTYIIVQVDFTLIILWFIYCMLNIIIKLIILIIFQKFRF